MRLGTAGRFFKSFGRVVKGLRDPHFALSPFGRPSQSGDWRGLGARVECHASVLTRARAATFRSLCRVQDRDPPLKSKSSSRAKSLSPSATALGRARQTTGLKGC